MVRMTVTLFAMGASCVPGVRAHILQQAAGAREKFRDSLSRAVQEGRR